MNTREGQQVLGSCDEDERGAHSQKNARCGHGKEEEGVQTPGGKIRVREMWLSRS